MNARIVWMLAYLGVALLAPCGYAQVPREVEPAQLALPAQRLVMDQIDELAASQQIDEALGLLQRLLDEASGRLVPDGKLQSAATLVVRRYQPLTSWVNTTTRRLLNDFPEAAERYAERNRELAQAELQEQQRIKDPASAQRAVKRFYATDVGSQLQLLLCDLYLERGWGVAAFQEAQQISSLVRFDHAQAEHMGHSSLVGTLAWSYLWCQADDPQQAEKLSTLWRQTLQERVASRPNVVQDLVSTLQRMIIASAMNPAALDADGVRRWVESLNLETLATPTAAALIALAEESRQWSRPAVEDSGLGAFTNLELPLSSEAGEDWQSVIWPAWAQTLERFTASSDRSATSRPRVGETERGTLPYFPKYHDGLVFVNELTRIVAFQLETGRPWPDLRPPLPLFDSRLSAAAYLPRGYPLVGTPRGTIEISDGCLYARMGSPITGRMNVGAVGSRTQSHSYLVGLDLSKQGSLLAGFPLHLNEAEFPGGEFDGPPLVWGEWLLVAIAERDNVGLRRRIAAFDRFSGEIIWKSPVVAVGTVAGTDRASLISHQLLSYEGGRLFYNSNLGSISCLDPLTGATLWQVQYSSTASSQRRFPTADRFRYRDLTPCLLSGGLLYCAPQDSPEIFALDASTGDLVWSSDAAQVADAVHLLGVHEDCLVVSGDRIVWLDKHSGRVRGRFPASTTPGPANALPSPRGLGRGTISAGRVFWPVAGEIFVFPASLPASPSAVENPPILNRMALDTRGSEGGNLMFAHEWMIFASPSRLMAFSPPQH